VSWHSAIVDSTLTRSSPRREEQEHRHQDQIDMVSQPIRSTGIEEFFHGKTHISCCLAQQDWRNVTTRMERNYCTPAVRVPELFVRTPVSNLPEAKSFQHRDNLTRSKGLSRHRDCNLWRGATLHG
jgi:hypothetical protein